MTERHRDYRAYANPEYAKLIASDQGAALTSAAMGSQIGWFPYILAIAIFAFSYSNDDQLELLW